MCLQALLFNNIPRIKCVGEEAVLLSGGLTSYFMKCIRVIISIEKSAVRDSLSLR